MANSSSPDLSPLYLEHLASLGWPVQVCCSNHAGGLDCSRCLCILGGLETWLLPGGLPDRRKSRLLIPRVPVRSLVLYLSFQLLLLLLPTCPGDQWLLYWADVSSELAILVPGKLPGGEEEQEGPESLGRGERVERGHPSLSLELEQEGRGRKQGRGGAAGGGQEQKVSSTCSLSSSLYLACRLCSSGWRAWRTRRPCPWRSWCRGSTVCVWSSSSTPWLRGS